MTRSVVGRQAVGLVVRAPATWVAERRYVLHVVLREWLGFEYDLVLGDGSEVVIQVAGHDGELTLPDVLFATSPENWLTEDSMPILPLARINTSEGTMPSLFGTTHEHEGAWRETLAGLALSVDVFGSVFFMITRYEEVVRRVRDRHDRFPASASLSAAEGLVRRPIADEYVDLLWLAMRTLWPGLTRRSTLFQLRLTHDVDEMWAAHGQRGRRVVRAIAGDLLRRRDPVLAARRSRSFVESRIGHVDRDPYDTFDFLMDTSERHGVRSTFYVMAGTTNAAFDGHYGLFDRPAARILRRINDRGHEVGLHASYGAYRSADLTRQEFEVLMAACAAAGFDQPTWGVRQHYLRFENPLTWQIQAAAGLEHDSTLGFADQIGFRAGTCREYPVFDLVEHRQLALRERPLVVMDGSLFDYMHLDLTDAAISARSVVDACRRHGGDAVLLFHNSAVAGGRMHAFYDDLVDDLA